MDTEDKRSVDNSTFQQQQPDIKLESDDISVSQLELMANKKKLNKKSSENSQILSESERRSHRTKTRGSGRSSSASTVDTTSSSSSDFVTRERSRTNAKMAEYENGNDQIRREKSEFLYKLNKINVKGKWSSLHLDMNNSLDEIKNEYERVRNEIQTERSVEFCKRMLLLGVQGMEMMNSKFDPLGVDLDGWSEAMGYSMENQEYDEVLAELYEKYKGRGNMSPEVKLIFMIISSATMFTVTKRLTKMDSDNMFKNFIGSMMGNGNNNSNGGGMSQQQQFQQQFQQQQFQQQNQQQQFQQQNQQQQFQQQFRQPQAQQQFYKPPAKTKGFAPMPHNANNIVNMDNNDNNSTEEDYTPSKMKSPDVDTIDIDNILRTMSERKRETEMVNQQELEQSDTTDIFKNVEINGTKKKGRGRPPKRVTATKIM